MLGTPSRSTLPSALCSCRATVFRSMLSTTGCYSRPSMGVNRRMNVPIPLAGRQGPAYISFAELEELLPGVDRRFVERAGRLGLLEVEGDRLRVPSPRLLHAGAELVVAGVPIGSLLDHAQALRRDMERIARRFVRLVAFHALDRYLRRAEELSDDELSELGDLVRRLRPLAQIAVDVELARAMERQTLALAGDRMAHLADPHHLAPRNASAT